jgi:hypothetical protein
VSFLPSVGPDISEGIPLDLSTRIQGQAVTSRRAKYDIEIGGIKFALSPDIQDSTGAYVRQSVAPQKEQQDTSKEPGEQSLEGYWIRSQNSWHRGAGINFYEPGAEPETQYRFYESSGVDVWTKGSATLLPTMTKVQNALGNVYIQAAGGGSFAMTDDSAVLGWIGPSLSLASPPLGYNGRWYFFGTNKYVKVGSALTASATIGVWNGATNTVIAKNATVMPKVWYLKDRLIVTHGVNVFEVPLNAAAPVDLSLASAATYAPADTGITWLDATSGPSAIYLAFDDGVGSGIVRFSLQDAASGSTPKLSQAYRVLDLPAGETLYRIFGYLGRFLLLSTSAGIRVCAVDQSGALTMGQVTVPASTVSRYGAFHADGGYVYAAGADVARAGTSNGPGLLDWAVSTGFVRINLGEPIGDVNDLRFAYATDVRSDATGIPSSSVRISDGVQAIAIAGSGVWKTAPGTRVTSGYLALGRVRYDTFVPKVFRSLDMEASLNAGELQVMLLDETEFPRYNLTMNPSTGIFESAELDLSRRYKYLRPLFRLTPSGGNTPELRQIQVRAMPSPARLRQIRYPLRCVDTEEDRNGVPYGQKDFAWKRIQLLEELEEAGVPVQVLDRRTGEAYTGMIEEIRYVGQTAPERQQSNFGGKIAVTITKLS